MRKEDPPCEPDSKRREPPRESRLCYLREEAADKVHMSPSSFDEAVRLGEMPKPRIFKCMKRPREVWIGEELLRALYNLPTDDEHDDTPYEELNL